MQRGIEMRKEAMASMQAEVRDDSLHFLKGTSTTFIMAQ